MFTTPDATPAADDGHPVRPAAEHARCLNGHLLQLAGVNHSHSHGFNLTTTSCNLCWNLRMDPHTWIDVPHRTPLPPDEGRAREGLVLVALPPSARAGVGRIEMRLSGAAVGFVAVQLCGVDRRGVMHRVEVAEAYRRRGIGSVLVAAALARGTSYRWSTGRIDTAPEVQAFCASLEVAARIQLGDPFYCSHMQEVGSEFV